MPESSIESIQACFMQFVRRAEKVSDEILAKTFVDAAPLLVQLSARNNQVLYGRRGTGKTHALKYLADRSRESGGYPIYIDLRTIGSNGSLYGDQERPLSERATQLILDVLEGIESELIQIAVTRIDDAPDMQQITLRLDDFSRAIREVIVRDPVSEREVSDAKKTEKGREFDAALQASPTGTQGSFGGKLNSGAEVSTNERTKESGLLKPHLDFGSLQVALDGLVRILGIEVLLLIDEWSEIPTELQPYLADLLRRTVLPQESIVVKIAAIEHRSTFMKVLDGKTFIGIELGADVTADINLDDFVVYDVDQTRAIDFFKNLIFKHYAVSDKADDRIQSPDSLISHAFTQITAFQEFVRAVEGVPRDALNLAALMARIAYGRKIAVEDVRRAAREWYTQDKLSITKNNTRLSAVLNFIIGQVIEQRRTRAFLFQAGLSQSEIEQLYDARLLHILKKSVAAKDEPGKRYDVYKIDYGCYVDLVTTSKAPLGFVELEDGSKVDVPPDDYRSIRRAILRPEELAKI
jgi:hypothetical protein